MIVEGMMRFQTLSAFLAVGFRGNALLCGFLDGGALGSVLFMLTEQFCHRQCTSPGVCGPSHPEGSDGNRRPSAEAVSKFGSKPENNRSKHTRDRFKRHNRRRSRAAECWGWVRAYRHRPGGYPHVEQLSIHSLFRMVKSSFGTTFYLNAYYVYDILHQGCCCYIPTNDDPD